MSFLPSIYDATSQQIKVSCEVQQLVGNNRVGAVAMSAADRLTRGTDVVDTGAPLQKLCRKRYSSANRGGGGGEDEEEGIHGYSKQCTFTIWVATKS